MRKPGIWCLEKSGNHVQQISHYIINVTESFDFISAYF